MVGFSVNGGNSHELQAKLISVIETILEVDGMYVIAYWSPQGELLAHKSKQKEGPQ